MKWNTDYFNPKKSWQTALYYFIVPVALSSFPLWFVQDQLPKKRLTMFWHLSFCFLLRANILWLYFITKSITLKLLMLHMFFRVWDWVDLFSWIKWAGSFCRFFVTGTGLFCCLVVTGFFFLFFSFLFLLSNSLIHIFRFIMIMFVWMKFLIYTF